MKSKPETSWLFLCDINSKISIITLLEHKIGLLKQHHQHSVEITEFFSHSDFTWNQSLHIWSLKICLFYIFRGSDYWFFTFFEWPKTKILELLDSPKLISRKICMTEKSWNFHTVCVIWSLLVIQEKNHKKPMLNLKNFVKSHSVEFSWFCIIQTLCEINFEDSWNAKSAIFTTFRGSEFWFSWIYKMNKIHSL